MRGLSRQMMKFILSFLTIVLFASPIFAAPVNVTMVAEKATVTMPDGAVIPMWGFRDTADLGHVPGDWKVPTISAVEGDDLTISLSNNIQAPGLVEPVSIIISGQTPSVMTPEYFTDADGDQRVISFTQSTASLGAPVDYVWNGLRAGTYLIQSGYHPAVQVQMGLYAVLKVDSVAGTEAYADDPATTTRDESVPYANEVTLLFSEIDPVLHEAVDLGVYGDPNAVVPSTGEPMTSTMEYHPAYFLINGQSYSTTSEMTALAPATTGQSVLIRFLNAGIQNRFPVLQGAYMTLLAEDGYRKKFDLEQYSVFLPPGKTMDVIIPSMPAGPLPLYDRGLDIANPDGLFGGMFTFLNEMPQVSANLVSLAEANGTAFRSFDYTAQASGGTAPYEYRFFLFDPATGWSAVGGTTYSAVNVWTWDATGAADGTYYIRVWARSQGSTAPFEAFDTVTHVIAPLSVSLAETAGTVAGTFDYAAASTGGFAPYEYRFFLFDPAVGWTAVGGTTYSATDTWTWDANAAAVGTYYIRVWARSQGSTSSFEAMDTVTHVVAATPATAVTLTEGDGTVTGTFDYTAVASGGSGPYEYRFFLFDPAVGWSAVGGTTYSATDTWTWDANAATAGTYYIRVWARSQGSTAAFDVLDTVTHVVP